jgi:hypothetical protein
MKALLLLLSVLSLSISNHPGSAYRGKVGLTHLAPDRDPMDVFCNAVARKDLHLFSPRNSQWTVFLLQ